MGQGGAAWISEGVVTLVDSEVSGNSAQSAGGGFGLSSSGEVVLNNSRICGNVAPGGPDSSQIYGSGTLTVVSGCVDESCDCAFDAIAADLNGDNAVNGADLGLLLANWGQPGTRRPERRRHRRRRGPRPDARRLVRVTPDDHR